MGKDSTRVMMMMEDDFEDLVDEDEDDDELDDLAFVSNGGDSGEDDLFDAVVGKLEEILMGEGFNEQLASFMQSHCTVFDRAPEMKLEYTPIFERYTQLIEEYVERGLSEALPDFDMEQFLPMLEAREDEISADVVDMLLSMSDFELFKESMVDYKEQIVEQTHQGDFLCLSGRPTVLHTDDMEDGEARPDLMGLEIKPLSPKGLLVQGGGDGPPPFSAVAPQPFSLKNA